MAHLDRITRQADLMGGRACIRGMRVTVAMVVGQIAAGHSIEAVLADYPYLEREDILQALRHAARLAGAREPSVTRSANTASIVDTARHYFDLQNLRRFSLATANARALYAQFGSTAPVVPGTLMERHTPGIYGQGG